MRLFSYAVNLEKRVRANHPLRQVKAAIDFSFMCEDVTHCYGRNGNESMPPATLPTKKIQDYLIAAIQN